jgi:SH3-like domain-containing protein
MKKRTLFIALILGATFLGGCAGPSGQPVSQVLQDPDFRPKRVYAVNLNQAWDLTLKALNREGIPLEMVNRETDVIQTGYQDLSAWERNKCDIRFSPEPQGKTYIYVRCRYEGRKEATEPFRDFTYSSPREAMKAEEELYRKLEPYILPFEGTSVAREEGPAKGTPTLAPAPAAEKPAPKPEAAAAPAPPPGGEKESIAAGATPPKVGPKAEAAALAALLAVAEVKSPPPPAPKVEAAPPLSMVSPPKSEIKEEALPVPLVTAAPTNVRMAPSIRSKVVTVLPPGERVEKIGESGNWIKIKIPSGEDAWVFSDFLRPSAATGVPPVLKPPSGAPSPQPQTTAAMIPAAKAERTPPQAKAGEPAKKSAEAVKKSFFATKDITRMRAAPNAKSKVVLVLKKGRQVEKLAESGEFTKVRLSWGDSGWVLTRSLQPLP